MAEMKEATEASKDVNYAERAKQIKAAIKADFDMGMAQAVAFVSQIENDTQAQSLLNQLGNVKPEMSGAAGVYLDLTAETLGQQDIKKKEGKVTDVAATKELTDFAEFAAGVSPTTTERPTQDLTDLKDRINKEPEMPEPMPTVAPATISTGETEAKKAEAAAAPVKVKKKLSKFKTASIVAASLLVLATGALVNRGIGNDTSENTNKAGATEPGVAVPPGAELDPMLNVAVMTVIDEETGDPIKNSQGVVDFVADPANPGNVARDRNNRPIILIPDPANPGQRIPVAANPISYEPVNEPQVVQVGATTQVVQQSVSVPIDNFTITSPENTGSPTQAVYTATNSQGETVVITPPYTTTAPETQRPDDRTQSTGGTNRTSPPTTAATPAVTTPEIIGTMPPTPTTTAPSPTTTRATTTRRPDITMGSGGSIPTPAASDTGHHHVLPPDHTRYTGPELQPRLTREQYNAYGNALNALCEANDLQGAIQFMVDFATKYPQSSDAAFMQGIKDHFRSSQRVGQIWQRGSNYMNGTIYIIEMSSPMNYKDTQSDLVRKSEVTISQNVSAIKGYGTQFAKDGKPIEL